MAPGQSDRERAVEDRCIQAFISSTFADMQSEREELVKRVFPQVRRHCEDRGVGWSFVDLRWGIPEELIDAGRLLPLCFEEIDRCHPFFIGILGERYGTVPTVPSALLEREAWIRNCADASLTELEIRYGVLNRKDQPYAFFYFRVSSPGADDGTSDGRLRRLKQEIASRPALAPRMYADSQELGRMVLEDLSRAIQRRFPEASVLAPEAREREDHLLFAKSISEGCIPRPAHENRLTEHSEEPGPPLAIFGDSGSGKSALIGSWVLHRLTTRPEVPHFYHFVGCSARSAHWRAMVVRLLDELRGVYEFEESVPSSSPELPAIFETWLARAASIRPFVLVIDGIDQLEYAPEDLELGWLPRRVSPNARLICTTASSRVSAELEGRGWFVHSLPPLDVSERREALGTHLAKYGKRLTDDQTQRLTSCKPAGNALFLRVLLEELRAQSGPEALNQAMETYLSAADTPELFQKVLARLERDYDRPRKNLVRDALALLVTSRRGLSEGELLDLLGNEHGPLPPIYWSPFRFAIQPNLTERQGLLFPAQRLFKQAVVTRYLSAERERQAVAHRLAEYLAASSVPSRAVDEVPWLFCDAGDWEAAARILADGHFLDAMWAFARMDLLSLWRRIERESALSMLGAYASALECLQDYQAVDALAWLLSHSGHLAETLRVRRFAIERHRRGGDDPALSHALGELSVDAFVHGDLDSALDAAREQLALAGRMEDAMALQQAHGNTGNILMHRGEYEQALQHYEAQEQFSLAAHYPRGLHASTGNQAKLWLLRGNSERALSLYRLDEYLCHSNGDRLGLALCLDNQSSILSEQGQLAAALSLAKESEAVLKEIGSPEDLQTNLVLQASIIAHTDFGQALQLFQEAEAILAGRVSPEARGEFFLGKAATILHVLGQGGRLAGVMELSEFTRREAVTSRHREYLTAAHGAALEAARMAPNEARAPYLAGITALALEQSEEAIGHFERALALRPGWEDAELRLGALLGNARDEAARREVTSGPQSAGAETLERGVALLRGALRARPDDVASWLNLANALISAQRPKEVVQTFRQAVSAVPSRPQLHYELLAGLAERGSHYDVLATAFEEAAAQQSGDGAAYYGLGLLRQIGHDTEGALHCFEEAIRIEPTLAAVYHNMGVVFLTKELLPAASAACESAIRLAPEMAEPRFLLGTIYSSQRRYNEALAAFESFIRLAKTPDLSGYASHASFSADLLRGKVSGVS